MDKHEIQPNNPLWRLIKRGMILGVFVVALIGAACTPEPPPPVNPVDPGDPGGPIDPPFPPYPVPTDWTFDIQLVGLDQVAPQYQDAFAQARDRWTELIAKAFNPVVATAEQCEELLPLVSDPEAPVVIDKLIIEIGVIPIDGPGKVLGYAGANCIANQSLLPVTGSMFFDVDDVDQLVANNQFTDVVIHEMGHVIGIGTLWNIKDDKGVEHRRLVSGSPPHYHGTHGMDAYSRLGGMGAVPVQAHGGAGTADVHWDEGTFQNELMTGYINPGDNPLSIVSVASLMDLGYVTDPNKADPFILPSRRVGPGQSFGAGLHSNHYAHLFSSGIFEHDDDPGEALEMRRPDITFIAE